MANYKITDLDSIAGNTDRAVDVIEIADVDANQSKKATVNQLLDVTSHPVGVDDVQTLTNKTITAPTISSPVLSGTVTGTYTIGGTPTFPAAVVTLTGNQTLTNKILTSPTINTATISNPTLTVDTVSEFTGANGVTVDGLNIKDGKLNTNNSVVTANITDDAVTDDKLDYPRWWQEIAKTTLGVSGDTITVSSIPARKYLMIVAYTAATGGTLQGVSLRFNNDSGANYAERYSVNGGADTTAVSQTSALFRPGTLPSGGSAISEAKIINVATFQKHASMFHSGTVTVGAATAPGRVEGAFLWANTVNQISRIDLINTTGTGDFAIGSEVIVLGHD